MRYFYDTEFIEDGRTIELISIGVVAEDGREYYAVSTEFDPERAGSWVRANVPGATVKTYDDDPSKYADLKAGRIDAVLNDRLVAADFIKRSGEPFKAAGDAFAPQQQGVAFKQDAALKAAIDKAIDDMRADGAMAALSNAWFGLDATK